MEEQAKPKEESPPVSEAGGEVKSEGEAKA